MTTRDPDVSRWKHFRASVSRQSRGRGKDTIAIIGLAVLGVVMMLWIFTQQKASLPSWAPIVGEDFAQLSAEFTSAQAVTPGQGQAVVIAGIQVGKISSVELDEGRAVVGMDIEPEYLKLIHPDATMLLRPKTNLNDMTVEIDPGTAPGHVEDGTNFGLARTEPNVNLEAFLSALDTDTQQYLQLLMAGGSQAIGGRGKQVSNIFRRFQPFAHRLADLNQVVAQRRVALERSIHYFQQLSTELARRDAQLERFVTASRGALGNFANEQEAIEETLVELPSTLSALRSAAESGNRFSLVARPALLELIPQAQASVPAFRATSRFFEQTTGPIRDQIRPFTREVRPVVQHTKQGAAPLNKSVRGFGNSLGAFNSFLNELAFKPKGKESFLFYLPWLGHNLNAGYNLIDAHGAVQRAQVMITCNGAFLAYAATRQNKPYLQTVLQSLKVPRAGELPMIPADPAEFKKLEAAGLSRCGPGVK
jgi:phospholipid/cholesterol/gamma-HCH transport system substrate-binding protein